LVPSLRQQGHLHNPAAAFDFCGKGWDLGNQLLKYFRVVEIGLVMIEKNMSDISKKPKLEHCQNWSDVDVNV